MPALWAAKERQSKPTKPVENVLSVFKRGMTGVYQHCGEAHLHRYPAEFNFRYNRAALRVSDPERTEKIIEGIEVKRLTYRRIGEAQNAYAACPLSLVDLAQEGLQDFLESG